MIKREEIPSYKIAYIRHIGSYGTDNALMMERLKSWARSNDLLHDTAVIFGIAHDNPETTKPENCRYDVCLVIPENEYVNSNEVNLGKTERGSYAVFTVSHTAEAIRSAWLEIFREMFKKGYLVDETRPILERYNVQMVSEHLCEICVPIK